MRKETISNNKTRRKKEYLTTTELARLCGVSRFTVINWTNQGKIRAMRTVGKHYRIPVSEAISFFESFGSEKKSVESVLGRHCWEYVQQTSCHKECGNCLIYGRKIDHCFVVVRQFGKEIIRCKGDCLNCSYFERFFSSYGERAQFEEPRDKKSKEANTEEKKSLYSFVYGVGRSVHGMKEKVVSLREKFAGRPSRTNGLR